MATACDGKEVTHLFVAERGAGRCAVRVLARGRKGAYQEVARLSRELPVISYFTFIGDDYLNFFFLF